MTRPIIALLYDFDKTLCTTDMENYTFIPALGYTPAQFWQKANGFGRDNHMDGLLAYMYTMIHECEEGLACWPKLDVNFTNKTQFVYRINKGVLDVSDDKTLNDSMPDDSKRIPFTNMIYVGGGLSEVPCIRRRTVRGWRIC